MAIFRGLGGAGDATNDSTISAVTEQALNAANSASEAATSATSASNSATAANSSASSAASSASAAATSATASAASAASVQGLEVAAAESAAAAAASEAEAFASAANAAASEVVVNASAAAAAASEAAAAASEAAALASQTAAHTSELAAASSEAAAASSASYANTQAIASAASASAALASENAAAASEAASAVSESNAATSAAAALASKNAAYVSEQAAAASEAAAATSEANAATSATASAASAAQAASLFQQFGDQYLGSFATEPTLDNSGNPLDEGDVFWDATNNVLKFYSGSAWVAPEAIATTAATNASNSASAAAVSASNSAASAAASLASQNATAVLATAAAASESAAAASEAAAATSEFNAASSASASASSASASAASASAAATSESNASTFEANALTYKNNAATSETNAANSASNAALSATNAALSETNAATSASNAATSESNAAGSASSASTSASAAATSANNAATSATSSASSAIASAASASDAATSKNNAASSASAAAISEANALTYKNNAATSESNAASSAASSAVSAAASANSAAASAASAAQAAAVYDSFDDRYLGTKSSAPTLDNDGNALVSGALYFNDGSITTADKGMWIYDGSAWIAATSASQAILATYKYTATAGQTVFSGLDSESKLLYYTAGCIIVTLNGIVLEPGTDYTATSGTSVTLTLAADLNDEVNIMVFLSFESANFYALGDPRYLQSETDPVYTASSWYTTTNNAANWNTAYGWGNHASAGYLTSFTETDPVYTASSWYTTTNNASNWNTAYSWGNHASAGYQAGDADLTAIAALTGTSGLLKKTAANTWTLDTTAYQPASTAITTSNIGSQSVNYATTAGSAPASDVYAWAKAATKPSYSYSEVGAPSTTGTNASGTWPISISGTAANASFLPQNDTRSVVTTPQTINNGLRIDFKQNSTEGLSDGGTYFGQITYRQYGASTDWTGGLSHQLGFTDNGNIWQRSGSGTTWGSWKKLLDSSNYNSYAPTLTGGGASGTWGINITGSAGSASSATYANTAGNGAKVWVNYDGTSGGIRSSFGVSSVTRNGSGISTVNFSSAFSNTNYCVVATAANNSNGNGYMACPDRRNYGDFQSTTYVRIRIVRDDGNMGYDSNDVYVACFA